MEQIEAEKWAQITNLKQPEKLCIEAWLDMTQQQTIDSYRLRSMNLRMLVDELIMTCDAWCQGTIFSNTHILCICDELTDACQKEQDSVWGGDVFLVRLCDAVTELRGKVDKGTKKLDKLLLTMRLCQSRLRQVYRTSLIEALSRHVNGGNNWRNLLRVLSSLLSDYVAEGLSIKHLYHQKRGLLEVPTGGRFEKRLSRCLERLATSRKWNVYLLVWGDPRALPVPPPFSDSIVLDPEIPEAVKDTLQKPEDRFYARVSVECPDRPSAAVKARRILDSFLDIATLNSPDDFVSVIPRTFVVDVNNPAGSGIEYSVLRDQSLSALASGWGSGLAEQVNTAMHSARIDPTCKTSLENALRNYRMATLAPYADSEYLHLWVAFEALATGDKTPITDAMPIIAKMMGMNYVRTLLENFIHNCVDVLKLQAIDAMLPPPDGGVPHRVEALCQLLTTPAGVAQVDAALTSPLMKCRLEELGTALSSPTATSQFVKRHVQRITWHLWRLYRVRNSLVHEAAKMDVSPYINHLDHYTYVFFGQFTRQLLDNPCYKSVSHFLYRTEELYAEYIKALDTANGTQLSASTLVNPWSMEI